MAVPARTGAHQIHLTGSAIAGAFSCATCHAVPTTMAHAGGPGRAPVTLSGAGQLLLPASLGSYSQATGNCTTYCHANRPVSWSGSGPLACYSCHGYPPPSGAHDPHVIDLGYWCADCHSATTAFPTAQQPYGAILGNHVDGTATVQFYSAGTFWDGASCTSACHDNTDWRSW